MISIKAYPRNALFYFSLQYSNFVLLFSLKRVNDLIFNLEPRSRTSNRTLKDKTTTLEGSITQTISHCSILGFQLNDTCKGTRGRETHCTVHIFHSSTQHYQENIIFITNSTYTNYHFHTQKTSANMHTYKYKSPRSDLELVKAKKAIFEPTGSTAKIWRF